MYGAREKVVPSLGGTVSPATAHRQRKVKASDSVHPRFETEWRIYDALYSERLELGSPEWFSAALLGGVDDGHSISCSKIGRR
jgi:hypothetical protein